jgi:hypothetical protein
MQLVQLRHRVQDLSRVIERTEERHHQFPSDHLAVPNPLLLHTSAGGGIAFNFADAFIITGNLILVLALCTLVVKNRRELHHRRVVEHIFRRDG